MFKDRLKYIRLSLANPDYILQLALANLFKNKNMYNKVLDYGSGNSPYKNLIKFKSYVTIDLVQNFNKNVDYIIKPNKKIPFKKNNFDLILLIDVLSHSNNFHHILNECYRVLKPNGKLIIYTPFIYRENETPNDFFRFTYFGLKYFLEKKFDSVNLKKIGNFYFTLYSIINEKNILNKEIIKHSLAHKCLLKLFNIILLPFFNLFIFKINVKNYHSVYHHLLAVAKK